MLARKPSHFVEVNSMVIATHTIGHRLEPTPRHIGRRSMGEMASRGKAQAQECIAGRHQGHEHRRMGGSPGMRLDVCELTSKKPCTPLYCNGFHLVDELASAIVA